MLVMTAKVDKKKIFLAIAALITAIGVLLALTGSTSPEAQPAAASAAKAERNEDRVKFLTDLGWDVTATPTESMQVVIPAQAQEVFDRYNTLQKSQGYDLSQYAGKTVMRYVYQVNNFPGATEPVYATLLVHQGQIIGGDITDTGPGGKIQGFSMPKESAP